MTRTAGQRGRYEIIDRAKNEYRTFTPLYPRYAIFDHEARAIIDEATTRYEAQQAIAQARAEEAGR